MKPFVSSLAVAALLVLAPAAFAGDPVWHFKPGKTFTYECTSEFHYIQFTPGTGATLQGGAQTNGLSAPGNNGGGTTGGTTTEDPQWETVVLRGTVLSVGDDGSARIEFLVERVSIEVRFDITGVHAKWDSAKSPKTELAGFRKYQAVAGHTFRAIIGPDGSVKEVSNGDWPKADEAGAVRNDKNDRENQAADAVHVPTAPSVWLNLVFSTAPRDGAAWEQTLKLPEEEKLSVKSDGTEAIGKHLCAKSRMKSADKERAVKAGDVKVEGARDVAKIASAMIVAAQKKGMSWFSRADGVLVKLDFEGSAELGAVGGTTHATMKWGVDLKGQGVTEMKPAEPDAPSK
ncbi:MAG: hypothetical protein FD180_2679 [Planctomycetota bacterium]|nr:MAG: hypothetical protein FD180_2679 [Planctomycetota bacterium]